MESDPMEDMLGDASGALDTAGPGAADGQAADLPVDSFAAFDGQAATGPGSIEMQGAAPSSPMLDLDFGSVPAAAGLDAFGAGGMEGGDTVMQPDASFSFDTPTLGSEATSESGLVGGSDGSSGAGGFGDFADLSSWSSSANADAGGVAPASLGSDFASLSAGTSTSDAMPASGDLFDFGSPAQPGAGGTVGDVSPTFGSQGNVNDMFVAFGAPSEPAAGSDAVMAGAAGDLGGDFTVFGASADGQAQAGEVTSAAPASGLLDFSFDASDTAPQPAAAADFSFGASPVPAESVSRQEDSLSFDMMGPAEGDGPQADASSMAFGDFGGTEVAASVGTQHDGAADVLSGLDFGAAVSPAPAEEVSDADASKGDSFGDALQADVQSFDASVVDERVAPDVALQQESAFLGDGSDAADFGSFGQVEEVAMSTDAFGSFTDTSTTLGDVNPSSAELLGSEVVLDAADAGTLELGAAGSATDVQQAPVSMDDGAEGSNLAEDLKSQEMDFAFGAPAGQGDGSDAFGSFGAPPGDAEAVDFGSFDAPVEAAADAPPSEESAEDQMAFAPAEDPVSLSPASEAESSVAAEELKAQEMDFAFGAPTAQDDAVVAFGSFEASPGEALDLGSSEEPVEVDASPVEELASEQSDAAAFAAAEDSDSFSALPSQVESSSGADGLKPQEMDFAFGAPNGQADGGDGFGSFEEEAVDLGSLDAPAEEAVADATGAPHLERADVTAATATEQDDEAALSAEGDFGGFSAASGEAEDVNPAEGLKSQEMDFSFGAPTARADVGDALGSFEASPGDLEAVDFGGFDTPVDAKGASSPAVEPIAAAPMAAPLTPSEDFGSFSAPSGVEESSNAAQGLKSQEMDFAFGAPAGQADIGDGFGSFDAPAGDVEAADFGSFDAPADLEAEASLTKVPSEGQASEAASAPAADFGNSSPAFDEVEAANPAEGLKSQEMDFAFGAVTELGGDAEKNDVGSVAVPAEVASTPAADFGSFSSPSSDAEGTNAAEGLKSQEVEFAFGQPTGKAVGDDGFGSFEASPGDAAAADFGSFEAPAEAEAADFGSFEAPAEAEVADFGNFEAPAEVEAAADAPLAAEAGEEAAAITMTEDFGSFSAPPGEEVKSGGGVADFGDFGDAAEAAVKDEDSIAAEFGGMNVPAADTAAADDTWHGENAEEDVVPLSAVSLPQEPFQVPEPTESNDALEAFAFSASATGSVLAAALEAKKEAAGAAPVGPASAPAAPIEEFDDVRQPKLDDEDSVAGGFGGEAPGIMEEPADPLVAAAPAVVAAAPAVAVAPAAVPRSTAVPVKEAEVALDEDLPPPDLEADDGDVEVEMHMAEEPRHVPVGASAEDVVETEPEPSDSPAVALAKDAMWSVVLQKRASFVSIFIMTVGLLIGFEAMFAVLGVLNDHPYTVAFTLPFLIWPALWFFAVYLRSGAARRSAPFKLVLQSFLAGLLADVMLFVAQWVTFLALIIVAALVHTYVFDNLNFMFLYYVGMILVYSFFVESLPEELFKYYVLSHICRVYGIHSKYAVIVYCVVVSLGFATFSGTVSVMIVHWTFSNYFFSAAAFFVHGLLTTTMHVVCGAWTAFGYIKRNLRREETIRRTSVKQLKLWEVMLPSIVLHGTVAAFISVIQLLVSAFSVDIRLVAALLVMAFLTLAVSVVAIVVRAKKLIASPSSYEPLLGNEDDEGEMV